MAKKSPLTWKDVLNNFLLRVTSTGQLPLLALVGLLFLMVYKTPSEDIVEVWRVLQQMLDRRSGLGYGLAAVTTLGWIAHSKLQRRRAERELKRISDERTQAQPMHFKKRLESSEK